MTTAGRIHQPKIEFLTKNKFKGTIKTLYITSCPAGLPKCSEQAYIEFESIEAIVKTASRTKFFIEFYSTCLEGEKSFPENLLNSFWLHVVDIQ